jgi:hypothetical protein
MVTRALARLRTLETMALASSRARDGLETLKLVEGIIKVWNQIQPLCEQLEEEDRKSKPVGSAQSGSVKL